MIIPLTLTAIVAFIAGGLFIFWLVGRRLAKRMDELTEFVQFHITAELNLGQNQDSTD